MIEEQDLLALLIDKIEYQIVTNKDKLKLAKHDIKKLEKSKADMIKTGIADYVFDDKINYITDNKEKLQIRLLRLKKIKYRLDVAKKMFEELN